MVCFFLTHRYSGEFSDFGVQIDDLASLIWEHVSFIFMFKLIFV